MSHTAPAPWYLHVGQADQVLVDGFQSFRVYSDTEWKMWTHVHETLGHASLPTAAISSAANRVSTESIQAFRIGSDSVRTQQKKNRVLTQPNRV
jgi:hypothetical protein